jgi:hypothetical protein
MYMKKSMRDHNGREFPGRPSRHEFMQDMRASIRERQDGRCADCGQPMDRFGGEAWQWVQDWNLCKTRGYDYPPIDRAASRMVCKGCGEPKGCTSDDILGSV